jgi:hypothetical protein
MYSIFWFGLLAFVSYNAEVVQKSLLLTTKDLQMWVTHNAKYARFSVYTEKQLPVDRSRTREQQCDSEITQEDITASYDDHRSFSLLVYWARLVACYVSFATRVYCNNAFSIASSCVVVACAALALVLFYLQSAYHRFPQHTIPNSPGEHLKSVVGVQSKAAVTFVVFLFGATFIGELSNTFKDEPFAFGLRLVLFLEMLVAVEILTQKNQELTDIYTRDTEPHVRIESNIFFNMVQVMLCTWPLLVAPGFWVFAIVLNIAFLAFLLQMNKRIAQTRQYDDEARPAREDTKETPPSQKKKIVVKKKHEVRHAEDDASGTHSETE